MNKSENITNLAVALAKFQAEVTQPKKTATNPHFRSKYATLDEIINTVKPVLAKHGLSYMQSCGGDGERITITTLLMHESGEWIESEPLVLKADKISPQGAGSAITYGRRYMLSAVLGVASEEDDDGNAAEGGSKANNNASQANGQGNGQKLSEKQVSRLWAIAKHAGVDIADVKKAMLKDYGVTQAEDMKKEQYDALCARLEKAGA